MQKLQIRAPRIHCGQRHGLNPKCSLSYACLRRYQTSSSRQSSDKTNRDDEASRSETEESGVDRALGDLLQEGGVPTNLSRAQRQINASRDVRNLYLNSAARARSMQENGGHPNGSVAYETTPKQNFRRLNLDDFSSKDVDPSQSEVRYTRARGAEGNVQFPYSSTGSANARSGRASDQPGNARGFSIRKQITREDPLNRLEKAGMPREAISDTPQPQSSASGPVDARSLGASRPSSEGAPRFTINRQSFTGVTYRASRSPPARRPGSAAPQPGRRSQRPQKTISRQDRKRESKVISSAYQKAYKEMMKAYEREQELLAAPSSTVFEPQAQQQTDFYHSGPLEGAGDVGMHGVLEQHKSLADWYTQGKRIINKKATWPNTRQRVYTKHIADGMADIATASGSDGKAFVSKGQEDSSQKQGTGPDVLNTLFSGAYGSARPQLQSQQADVLSHVARQAARNGSYIQQDENNMTARVSRVMSGSNKDPARGSQGIPLA